MADYSGVCVTADTYERWESLSDSVKTIFVMTYKNLNRLQGRSLREYIEFLSTQGSPPRCKYMFNKEDYKLVSSSQPEHWDIKLLHKMLQNTCDLSLPRTYDDPKALESSLSSAWNNWRNINDTVASYTDRQLNSELNSLERCINQISDLVGEKLNTDTTRYRVKRRKTENRSSNIKSNMCYKYKISAQRVVHRMFVFVYKELSCLEGRSVKEYLKKKDNFLRVWKKFNDEERKTFEDPSATPEKMSISLLYKLLRRVCSLEDKTKWNQLPENTIEYSLNWLENERKTMLPSGECDFERRSYQLKNELNSVLHKIAEKQGKDVLQLIKEMPEECLSMNNAYEGQSRPASCHFSSHICNPDSTPPPVAHSASRTSLPSLCSQSSFDNSLTHNECNISYLFKALSPKGPVAKALAEVYIALEGDIRNLNARERKMKFNPTEVKLAKEGKVFEMDVTLLSKLIMHTCGLPEPSNPVWTTPAETLEHKLHLVKKRRNYMAHEISEISDQELKDQILGLESELESLMIITSKKTNKNFDAQIKNMKDALHPLEKRSSLDTESYCKNVEELKEKLLGKLVTDATSEFQQQYQKASAKKSSPITWSDDKRHDKLTIDKIYTDIRLADDVKTVSVEDVLCYQESQAYESRFRIIIVQGPSGVGKTMLCKYITHCWVTKDNPHLNGVDLLFHIPCRYVTAATLKEHLRTTYPNAFKSVDKDDIMPLLQDLTLMFLIDGYDEAGPEAKKLVDDILQSCPESKIIITTKPQWGPNLSSKVGQYTSCYSLLNVQGLENRRERDRFIRKIFEVTMENHPEKDSKYEALIQYLDQDEVQEKLEALITLPLTLSLLALLWIEDSEGAKMANTVAYLYFKVVYCMLKRLSDTLKVDYDYCEDWVLCLGQVAWENLKDNVHHLKPRNLKLLKNKGVPLGINGMEAISFLLDCETSTYLTYTKEIWSFTHNYQQEFFAAKYIANEMTQNRKKLADLLEIKVETAENENKQMLMPVIEFVAGILHYEEELTTDMAREISNLALVQAPWSFTAMKRITQEYFSKIDEENRILKEMFASETMHEYLDGYDPESVLWILRNTAIQVPASIQLRASLQATCSIQPLAKFLVEKSCKLEVIWIIDNIKHVETALNGIKSSGAENVKFVLQTWNLHPLAKLLKQWDWKQHLYLSLTKELFPLLWWETMMYLGTVQSRCTVSCSDADEKNAKILKNDLLTLQHQCRFCQDLPVGDVKISF